MRTLLLCFATIALAPLAGAEITFDQLFDAALMRSLAVPRTMWLADERLLLDDSRKPEAERGLERLDPSTLQRERAGDAAKLLEGWKALLGEKAAPKWVGMPSAVAADSRTCLFERDGDLFLVDLHSGTVRRATNTEAGEQNARFSPDGKSLAFEREHDVYILDTATLRERRLTRDGSATTLNGTLSWVYWEEIFSRRDEAFWWAPDSSALLLLQSDDTPVSQYPLVDHEPEVPRIRWQRYPKAGGVNPRVRAGIVALEPGAGGGGPSPRWLDLGDPAPEYIARAGWLPDSKTVAIQTLNRAQNHLQLWIIERESGRHRLVVEERAKAWINLHDDLHFLPGRSDLIWASERDGFRHLYIHALSGDAGRALTSGSAQLLGGGLGAEWSGAVAHIDHGAGRLLYHAQSPSPIECNVFRVALDGSAPVRVTQGEGSHRVAVSPRGRFFVDSHSRAGVPPSLTLHRADGTALAVLGAAATDRLEALSVQAPELFDVRAEDGTPLQARLYRPKLIEPGRRYPAIVYVYGGPTAPSISNSWDGFWFFWSNFLAARGFAVFSVDPRSSSDRGKAFEDTAHRRFYGDGELKDMLAGVRHLKSLPFIDPDRVGIWGWSGGGTSTVYAMTRSKEFRAGIEVAGVGDQRYYDTVYTERYMGTPRENEEGYKATASANGAANLHGRLLLVHGTFDDNVHPQNVMRLVDALVAAGKPFDLMLYPGRGHGIGDPAARKHLFALMLEFWERWLKRPPARTF